MSKTGALLRAKKKRSDSNGNAYPMTAAAYRQLYDQALTPSMLPDYRRDGTEFSPGRTKAGRWAISRLQRGLWADPKYRALREEITAALMAKPERRDAISSAISAALEVVNKLPEVIERRRLAAQARAAAPRSTWPDKEEEARLAYGDRPPCLDDIEGYVYVVRMAEQPAGPYKIGSSFNVNKRRAHLEADGYLTGRKEMLERDGYYCYFPAPCKLKTEHEVFAYYFRRVELKAHARLGMDAEHKKKFGEMSFAPLEIIIKVIEEAKALVELETREAEERVEAERRAQEEFPERMLPLDTSKMDPLPPEFNDYPAAWGDVIFYNSRSDCATKSTALKQAMYDADTIGGAIVEGLGSTISGIYKHMVDRGDKPEAWLPLLMLSEKLYNKLRGVYLHNASNCIPAMLDRDIQLAAVNKAFENLLRLRRIAMKTLLREGKMQLAPASKRRWRLLLRKDESAELRMRANHMYDYIRNGSAARYFAKAHQMGMPAQEELRDWSLSKYKPQERQEAMRIVMEKAAGHFSPENRKKLKDFADNLRENAPDYSNVDKFNISVNEDDIDVSLETLERHAKLLASASEPSYRTHGEKLLMQLKQDPIGLALHIEGLSVEEKAKIVRSWRNEEAAIAAKRNPSD